MKIQQTDQYPCGEKKTYPRYEFWGFGYAPSTGKPGCPKHGNRCKIKVNEKLVCSMQGKHFFSWRDGKACPVCGEAPPKEE
jgi:hypothetical protein